MIFSPCLQRDIQLLNFTPMMDDEYF